MTPTFYVCKTHRYNKIYTNVYTDGPLTYHFSGNVM